MPRRKRAVKCHDQAEETAPSGSLPVNAEIIEERPEETGASSGHTESVFEDFDDYCVSEKPETAVVPRPDALPALDGDLTPEQKRLFVELVKKEMPLEERAKQLATLARFTDTTRAPVALRAIIEMNLLDDMRKEQPSEDSPMFVLPADSKVAILVKKADK